MIQLYRKRSKKKDIGFIHLEYLFTGKSKKLIMKVQKCNIGEKDERERERERERRKMRKR